MGFRVYRALGFRLYVSGLGHVERSGDEWAGCKHRLGTLHFCSILGLRFSKRLKLLRRLSVFVLATLFKV